MKEIAIIGAGGHARSVFSTIVSGETFKPIGFFDDSAIEDEMIMTLPVKKLISLQASECKNAVIAIGDNSARMFMSKRILDAGFCTPTIVSKKAFVDPTASIGVGCMVSAFAYIGPEARVGRFSIVNTGAIVEHESVVGPFTHLAPSSVICGRSRVGRSCFVGASAVIRDKIGIADHTTIGAGTVVVRPVSQSGLVLVGNPGRVR